jgi:putative ABC transport system permease protein
MFKLAFRNIFRNRLRTGLTLAAIVSGVAAIIVSGGFVEDVFVQLRESTIHSRLGHAQIFRKGYLDYGQREPTRYLIEAPQPLIDQVRSIPHVQSVMTRVNFSGLANNGRADLPIIGEGVEADKEARLGTAMSFIAGHNLRDDDPFGVIVGEGVAAALQLELGSPLNLTVNTPEGALNTLEFTVAGVFRSFQTTTTAPCISADGRAGVALHAGGPQRGGALDDTAHRCGRRGVRSSWPLSYEVKPWHELADFYNKTVALYRRQFGALQAIILVMLVLSVASTVNMVVYERTGEFGTLLRWDEARRSSPGAAKHLLGCSGGWGGRRRYAGWALSATAYRCRRRRGPMRPHGEIRIAVELAAAALTGAGGTLAALLPGACRRLVVVEPCATTYRRTRPSFFR